MTSNTRTVRNSAHAWLLLADHEQALAAFYRHLAARNPRPEMPAQVAAIDAVDVEAVEAALSPPLLLRMAEAAELNARHHRLRAEALNRKAQP